MAHNLRFVLSQHSARAHDLWQVELAERNGARRTLTWLKLPDAVGRIQAMKARGYACKLSPMFPEAPAESITAPTIDLPAFLPVHA